MIDNRTGQPFDGKCPTCRGSGFTCSCGDERRAPCQGNHHRVTCGETRLVRDGITELWTAVCPKWAGG